MIGLTVLFFTGNHLLGFRRQSSCTWSNIPFAKIGSMTEGCATTGVREMSTKPTNSLARSPLDCTALASSFPVTFVAVRHLVEPERML